MSTSQPASGSDTKRTGVIVVEHDPMFRRKIVARVSSQEGLQVVGDAGDLADANRLMTTMKAELALLDLNLPDGSAVALIPTAREKGIAVLVLTVSQDDSSVYDAIEAGAGGYLLKADALDQVGQALRTLRDGGAPISPRIARRLLDYFKTIRKAEATPPDSELTPREWQVVELFTTGATYSEAARILGLSVNTVRGHVRNLYEKLHVCSKTEAVIAAMKLTRPKD